MKLPALEVGSPAWRQRVEDHLLAGYGVEDIAIYLRCHVDRVRTYVVKLRADGTLERWWGK